MGQLWIFQCIKWKSRLAIIESLIVCIDYWFLSAGPCKLMKGHWKRSSWCVILECVKCYYTHFTFWSMKIGLGLIQRPNERCLANHFKTSFVEYYETYSTFVCDNSSSAWTSNRTSWKTMIIANIKTTLEDGYW